MHITDQVKVRVFDDYFKRVDGFFPTVVSKAKL